MAFDAPAAPPPDLTRALIDATVQIDQPLGGDTRRVGTGFLVSAPRQDGTPRVVLVTAKHVFENLPGPSIRIGWRYPTAGGAWRYAPGPLTTREGARRLWTAHPTEDVAVIAITAPPEFAKAAIPQGWLADEASFERWRVRPADEMLSLGFPRGLSGNAAGFPILRAARVASYPLWPASAYPRFLLDFRVFAGNSGGPVFLDRPPQPPGAAPTGAPEGFVAGVLSKSVEVDRERLELGIVVHAKFVREAIALLDAASPPAPAATAAAP